MNDNTLEMVASRFRILGDPSRLRLLQALAGERRTVAEVTEACGMTQANASKQLGVLLRDGLVLRAKEGLHVYYQVADPDVFRLCDLVCGSLEKRLTRDLSDLHRES
jgi:ArsR family transcriptional regulator